MTCWHDREGMCETCGQEVILAYYMAENNVVLQQFMTRTDYESQFDDLTPEEFAEMFPTGEIT